MFFGLVCHTFVQMSALIDGYAGIIAQAPVAFIAVFSNRTVFTYGFSFKCIFQTFAAVFKNECFAFRNYII